MATRYDVNDHLGSLLMDTTGKPFPRVADNPHNCPICLQVKGSFVTQDRHLHLDAPKDCPCPDDLMVNVLVTTASGTVRFVPTLEALVAFKRYRSAEWYVPAPLSGVASVVLAIRYTAGGQTYGDDVTVSLS